MNSVQRKYLLALVCVMSMALTAPLMAVEYARESFERFPDVQVNSLGAGAGLFAWNTNSTPNWMVRAGSLVYTDGTKTMPSLGGHMAWEGENGNTLYYARHNINWTYQGLSTPSVYRSFLVKCTKMPTGAPDYFACFRGSSHDSSGRVYMRATANPDEIELGVKSSSTGAPTWAVPPVTIAFNTVNMIVVRVDLNPGDDNDVTSLWANPLLDIAEPQFDISAGFTGGNELLQPAENHNGSIGNIVFKRDGNPNAGEWEWDDDRFGTTWEDVTNTGPISTADTTPPRISDHEPDQNIEVPGPLTAVSMLYNEGLEPGTTPVAGDLTVNGDPATAIRNLSDGSTAGRWLFTGFAPVPVGTTATISLRAGAGTDVGGNLFSGDTYQVAVVAQPTDAVITEHFNYENGLTLSPIRAWANANNDLNEHGILNFDGAGDVGSSLAYTGLENLSGGGRLYVTGAAGVGNDDIRHSYSTGIRGEGNTAYASFLINFSAAPDAKEYVFYFYTPSSFSGSAGKILVDVGGPTDVAVGVRINTQNHDVFVPASKNIALNSTALVVCKVTMNPGEDNDTMEVWVNPALGAEPASDAITTVDPDPDAAIGNHLSDVNPAAGIRGVDIRPQDNADVGTFEIDEIRLGTTWESVTGNPAADIAPPVIETEFPVRGTSVLGSITHVEVNFDESVTSVTASMLTVDGSAATTVTRNLPNRLPTGTGSYVFYGFTPVTTPGDVTIALEGALIKDAAGNSFVKDTWTVTLAAPPADGLLLHEAFDYANGEALVGKGLWTANSGFDAAGAANIWVLNGNPSSSNLFYGDLPQSTGGKVMGVETRDPIYAEIDNARLPLAMPVVGEGSSLYASFIYAGTGEVGVNAFFAFFQSGNSDTPQVGRIESSNLNDPLHTLSNRWTTNQYSPVQTESGPGHAVGEPVFVVVKLMINPGNDNDSITMWVNPDLGYKTERIGAMISAVQANSDQDLNPAHGLKEFVLRTNNTVGEFSIDELRLGTTWESVTPAVIEVIPKAGASHWLLYEN